MMAKTGERRPDIAKKTALITDLDNTLFDWADIWYKCFSAMLDEIVRISGLPRETLIPEIQAIHQKYGTSEYSFLIEELPSLRPLLKGKQATEMFAPAIEAFSRRQCGRHASTQARGRRRRSRARPRAQGCRGGDRNGPHFQSSIRPWNVRPEGCRTRGRRDDRGRSDHQLHGKN